MLNAFELEYCFFIENADTGLSFPPEIDHEYLSCEPGKDIPDFVYKDPEFNYEISIELKMGKGKPKFSEVHGADYIIFYDLFAKTYTTYVRSLTGPDSYEVTAPIEGLVYPKHFQLVYLIKAVTKKDNESVSVVTYKIYEHDV